MAKKVRRRTVKRKPHRDPDSRVQVEQKLGELRAYYEEGQESLARSVGKSNVPYGSLTGVTASDGERIRKARVFAREYTLDDLNRLEQLCREHGMALGRSLIDRLATVHDRSKRQKLEADAIAGRWSKIILDREIPPAVRRPEPPAIRPQVESPPERTRGPRRSRPVVHPVDPVG